LIKYPDKFRQTNPAGFDGVFDWDFLKPAFDGTKIEPMDIDAVIERKGKFLIFETKDIDKAIPQGQQITLKNLIILGEGKIHLMVIYGKSKDSIIAIEEWCYRDGKFVTYPRRACNGDYVLSRVAKWFHWANN
jgi:hypothetical protein